MYGNISTVANFPGSLEIHLKRWNPETLRKSRMISRYIISSNSCLIIFNRSAAKYWGQLCTIRPDVISILYDELPSESFNTRWPRKVQIRNSASIQWYRVSADCIADSLFFRWKFSWNFMWIIFYSLILTNKPYCARKSALIINLVISATIKFHVKSPNNLKSNRNGIVPKVDMC